MMIRDSPRSAVEFLGLDVATLKGQSCWMGDLRWLAVGLSIHRGGNCVTRIVYSLGALGSEVQRFVVM